MSIGKELAEELQAENDKLRAEVEQLKACLSASEEVRDANFQAKDRAFLQNEGLRKALEALLAVCNNILSIEDGGKNYIWDLAVCKRETVLPALEKFGPMAAVEPTLKRKGTGCDCGATVAFPTHRPGCPLGGPYEARISELEGDLGRANETVSLLLGKLRDQLDGIIKDWGEAFAKHGFILHRGLTPEQNAAEWRAQIQLDVICKEVREKRVEEPRYCVKCGRRMEAADAAHPFTCEGKGNPVNPAPFID